MSSRRSKKTPPQPKCLQLLKAVWEKSWTVYLSYSQGAFAAVLGGLSYTNTVVTSSEFKNVLSTVNVPWYVPTGIAVIGLLTFLAHGRENA